MNDLQRLVHVEAIKCLKARYFRFLDDEDWDSLAALFSEDVRVEFPGRDPMESRAALMEYFVKHHTDAEVVSVHHGHMPEIALVDDDNASAIWAMSDLVDRIWKKDGRRETFVGFGHYHERYVRRNETWIIAAMRLERLRLNWLPLDDATGFPFPHRQRSSGSS